MKTRILATLAAAGLLLTSCASEESSGQSTAGAASPQASQPASQGNDVLDSHGLSDLSAKELIEKLDAMPVAERPQDLIASIRPNEVLITDVTEQETSVPIPEGDFYLSFSPYINSSHECYFHSLTTCRGEMGNQDVHVTITDNESGEVLVDEDSTTFDNGFLGVWLPTGIEATLAVTVDGMSATEVISTKNDDDLTCLTTLKLS